MNDNSAIKSLGEVVSMENDFIQIYTPYVSFQEHFVTYVSMNLL